MKKITSIFLITLLLLDSCGYIFVYIELSNYFKQNATQKINDFIPDNNLEIITLHKSEITKIDSPVSFIKRNEIKYKDELYDIYKELIKDDSIYYYCINDKNENILENAFSAFVESKTQDSPKNIPLHNILVNIFKVAIVPLEFNYSYVQNSIKFVVQIEYLFPQYSIDIPTPPPKS